MWSAAVERAEALSGQHAAALRCDEAADARIALDEEIHHTPARTHAGLIAKARVELEAAETAELDASAVEFLREVAAFPPVETSNLKPVPIDHIRFPIGRYPVGIPREVVESYRTWLWQELRFLEHEVYGTVDDPIPYWMANPAGSFHSSRQAPPSTRAAAVLGLLGLMPTETFDGKPLSAVRAA